MHLCLGQVCRPDAWFCIEASLVPNFVLCCPSSALQDVQLCKLQSVPSNCSYFCVCRLYGRVLNLNRVGITAKGSGCFFDRFTKAGFMHSNKGKGGFVVPGRVSLAVEDPIDPTNDTARGSYNMKVVRQVRKNGSEMGW